MAVHSDCVGGFSTEARWSKCKVWFLVLRLNKHAGQHESILGQQKHLYFLIPEGSLWEMGKPGVNVCCGQGHGRGHGQKEMGTAFLSGPSGGGCWRCVQKTTITFSAWIFTARSPLPCGSCSYWGQVIPPPCSVVHHKPRLDVYL